MNIRVVVIDDYPLVRDGLAAALEIDPGIKVVARAADGDEGLRLVHEHKPDIVLLDITMPGMGGLEMLRRLRDELPDVRALVLTANADAETLFEAVTAGASGYLGKTVTGASLRSALITVHGGGSFIDPSLAGHLLDRYASVARGERLHLKPLLGEREHAVLRLIVKGKTDREIAAELFISPRTVQNHLTSLREKTGTKRRSEMARWAIENSAD